MAMLNNQRVITKQEGYTLRPQSTLATDVLLQGSRLFANGMHLRDLDNKENRRYIPLKKRMFHVCSIATENCPFIDDLSWCSS